MRQRNIVLLNLCLFIVLTAFSPRSNGKPVVPKAVRKQYLEVPAGEAVVAGERKQVGAFFLSRTEVSNLEYREFTADLKRNGDDMALAAALPDSTQWATTYAFCEPFRIHYNSHPAYDNYPVVNVSQQAAMAYCTWLEGKLNAMAPEGTSYTVRLPSQSEWVRAAEGLKNAAPYAWGGPFTRNKKGCFLANYRAEQGDTLEAAARFHDNADITAPVTSYFPNDLGLFNMNGNVAEWLQEPDLAAGGSWRDVCADIRNESVTTVTGPAPTVGFRPLVEVVVAQ